MSDRDMFADCEWRTGRKVGRTIYAKVGGSTPDEDALIGMMDTSGLAAVVVEAHNERLRSREGRLRLPVPRRPDPGLTEKKGGTPPPYKDWA